MTLVTGASGFVGSHLVGEMRRRRLPVRGVTRGVVPASLPSRPTVRTWIGATFSRA
ncbi:MAG: NAD-dependent epimerase/dehydratase family protein [Allorhizobium sp.]